MATLLTEGRPSRRKIRGFSRIAAEKKSIFNYDCLERSPDLSNNSSLVKVPHPLTVNPHKAEVIHPHMVKTFFQEEEGQTLVEYGLLISLVALVVIAVLTLLGKKVSNTFNAAANKIGTATS